MRIILYFLRERSILYLVVLAVQLYQERHDNQEALRYHLVLEHPEILAFQVHLLYQAIHLFQVRPSCLEVQGNLYERSFVLILRVIVYP